MPKCDFNFIEITLWHRCFPVNLLDNFGAPFYKNTSGGLLLQISLIKTFYILIPVNFFVLI